MEVISLFYYKSHPSPGFLVWLAGWLAHNRYGMYVCGMAKPTYKTNPVVFIEEAAAATAAGLHESERRFIIILMGMRGGVLALCNTLYMNFIIILTLN